MEDLLLNSIIEQAELAFPSEACGFILADYSIRPCENKAPDPTKSFLIDPLDFIKHKDTIIAVYHSHPNKDPLPSEEDKLSSNRSRLPFYILSYPSKEVYVYNPVATEIQPYEGRKFIYGLSDCLSLVTEFYSRELGINLGNGYRKYWDWWQDIEHENDFINGILEEGFEKVTTLEKNDIIIMQVGAKVPNHLAVYLGDSIILHHPSIGNLSRQEVYGFYWRNNTVAYLRYRG